MQKSGFVAIIGAIIISRIISERGFRRLSDEEKVRLMDGFSAIRAYSMIPILLLIGAYWFIATRTVVSQQYLTIGYFGLFITYVVALAFLNQHKLHQLGLPSNYRRAFTIAQAIRFLGIAWFFFTIFYGRNP